MNEIRLMLCRLANALRWPKNWVVIRRAWNRRIQDVLNSPDNARLPRVPGAGAIRDGWQTMHNGLLVAADGYFGNGMTRMLKANKGCHEPEEEVVFAEVMRRLSGAPVMIECGAYWAFYSMWFLKEHSSGRAYMIEPDASNLRVGVKNFERNGLKGSFHQAGLGERPGMDAEIGTIVSVSSFMESRGLTRANILHMDIQGAEEAALFGAKPILETQRIDYVFVSTHSQELHDACVQIFLSAGYVVDVSVSPAESSSVDGLIVARSPLCDQNPLLKPLAQTSEIHA